MEGQLITALHATSIESRGDIPPAPTDFPPIGAVLNSLRKPGALPTWVQVGPLMRRNNGTVLHGQSPGFLGSKYSPLVINQDLAPANVRVEAVTPNPETPVLRLTQRRRLLEQIDEQRRLLELAAEAKSLD